MLIIVASCSPDPNNEPLEKWYIDFGNTAGKRVFPGETINVSLQLRDHLYGNHDNARVEFGIVRGGGTLSGYSVEASGGRAQTVWTPGGDSFKSILRAELFRNDGKYITSRDLYAYCFVPGEWNKIDEEFEKKFSDLAADTIEKVTLAISGGKVYRRGSRYYLWEELKNPVIAEARTLDIDNAGVFYITTWNGEVVKSTDNAITWTRCTKPFPDIPYYVFFTVSNDGYLWAGRFDAPSKLSKDGGTTWLAAGENIPSAFNDNVFRLRSGAIICHGTKNPDKLRLRISFDDGLTWITRETPGYSTSIYVNENDEIFIGTQESGYAFYKTTDLGLSYERVYSVYPKWGPPDGKLVYKWNGFYFVGIAGFGVLKSPDLMHFETLWSSDDMRELYMDHEGTFIVRPKELQDAYYYREP